MDRRKGATMGSGMNVEKAKEYAKTMTYSRAVSNCYHAKGIMYRKATLIKLRELAELADRLDQMDKMIEFDKELLQMESTEFEADTPQTDCETCKHNKLEWYSEKCDGCSKAHSNYEPQADCPWK